MEAKEFVTEVLSHQGKSTPFPFVVLLGAGRRTFIRVLAQFADDGPLGGTPPTVLITAGEGPAAEVMVSDEVVPIIGSDQTTIVATATCTRTPEDIDTYLVVIEHDKDSGPWSFVIRNDESNPLRFFGFHADDEAATLRPWMQLSAVDEDGVRLGGRGPTMSRIRVRNVGPIPLEVEGTAGETFGSAPATIAELPATPTRPHRTGTIVVACPPLDEVAVEMPRSLSHTFATNDPDKAHGRIEFVIAPPLLPRFRCRFVFDDDTTCPCREFVRMDPPDDDACRTCFHEQGFHGMPSSPHGSHPH